MNINIPAIRFLFFLTIFVGCKSVPEHNYDDEQISTSLSDSSIAAGFTRTSFEVGVKLDSALSYDSTNKGDDRYFGLCVEIVRLVGKIEEHSPDHLKDSSLISKTALLGENMFREKYFNLSLKLLVISVDRQARTFKSRHITDDFQRNEIADRYCMIAHAYKEDSYAQLSILRMITSSADQHESSFFDKVIDINRKAQENSQKYAQLGLDFAPSYSNAQMCYKKMYYID